MIPFTIIKVPVLKITDEITSSTNAVFDIICYLEPFSKRTIRLSLKSIFSKSYRRLRNFNLFQGFFISSQMFLVLWNRSKKCFNGFNGQTNFKFRFWIVAVGVNNTQLLLSVCIKGFHSRRKRTWKMLEIVNLAHLSLSLSLSLFLLIITPSNKSCEKDNAVWQNRRAAAEKKKNIFILN